MLQAPAALLVSLALAGVTRYTAGVSVLGRYYTDLEAVQPLSTTALEVEPRLGLEQEGATTLFRIAYHPRLVTIATSLPPQFFNQGSLSLALRPDPTLRVTGSAGGCYGTNDFRVQYALACGAAALAPVAGPQPIPQVPTVKYMSASGALAFESRPSPRIAVSGTASYLAQGGADAPTRMVLPLQHGPSLLAALEWNASRDDALTSSLSGSYYTFLREAPTSGASGLAVNAWVSQLVGGWQHAAGRGGQLRLGVGVGLTGDASDLAHLVLRRTSAVGELGFQQVFGTPGDTRAVLLGVGARVTPFVDFTSGLAYERAEASASLAWPIGREWRLDASCAAGVGLDGVQRGQWTATAVVSATWIAARWVQLSTGLNGLRQAAGPDFTASSLRQVGFFVGATFAQTGQL
jgi:hypothetical protein